jgi:MOSC domain-containing protein YiiM
MSVIAGKVVSVHVGAADTLSKELRSSIEVALDGIVGDRHRGLARPCWEGDKQAEGVVRRNERHWSAVSVEEISEIQQAMNLAEPLLASSLGANLCLQGIPELSRLVRGTLLKFSSGVVLMVEEYNPPCSDMGEKLAQLHTSNSGEPIASTAFSQAAKFLRGAVGVVEVAGVISAGDEVTVELEQLPKWLRNPREH